MIYDPEFTDLDYYYKATAEFSDETTEDVTESAKWTIENANTCQNYLNHSTYECERMDTLEKGRLITCSQKFCQNSWNMCNCSWGSINVKASYTYNGISKEGSKVVNKSFIGILYNEIFYN